MKKLILFVILTAMCLSLFACTPAETATSSPSSEVLADSMEWCIEQGYTEGIPEENLVRENSITPEMLSVMLANLSEKMGFNLNGYLKDQESFSDAETGTWYSPAVHWVYIYELMGRDSLGIGESMTKETIGKFLYQYLYKYYDYRNIPIGQDMSFADSEEVTTAKTELAGLEYLNLLILDNENKFYPTKKATVEEACALLRKMAQFCEENISVKNLMKHGVSTDFYILQYCDPEENIEILYDNPQLYKTIWEKGFDHIRVTAAFDAENEHKGYWPDHAYYDEEGNIHVADEYLEILDTIIQYALDANLYVVLDMHNFEGKSDEYDPEQHQIALKNFKDLWEFLTQHYADISDKLLFDLYNEPIFDLDVEAEEHLVEDFMYTGIEAVRKYDQERVLFVAFLNGTHAFVDNYTELIEYCKKDPNIWYTTHNYSPYQFTLENGRTHIDSATGEYIYYPFDEEIETETKSVINTLYEQEIEHGIDYWVGEWGVYDNVKHEDRVAYHKTSAEKYRQLGIAWCKWELFAGFAIYDGPNDTWDEELIAALFS